MLKFVWVMYMSDNKKLHNRIMELRKRKGLTLQQVADAIGVGNNTISRYETGKREPKLKTWEKLANFFNVSVAYLMGISNSPNDGFDEIFIKDAPYDIDEWNNLFDTNAAKISTSLSAEQESNVVSSLTTYKRILIDLIPYVIEEKLDTNEVEELKKNNLKMLINIINTLDINWWPQSQFTSKNNLESPEEKVDPSDPRVQKKLNKILKKINELLKDELESN